MIRRTTLLFSMIAALSAGAMLASWAPAELEWVQNRGQKLAAILPAAAGRLGRDATFPEGFVAIVDQVTPAVVNVTSSRVVRSPHGAPFPFLADPHFWHFFGEQYLENEEFFRQFAQPERRREENVGSGVIVSEDGLVLTNFHVVEGASDIAISLADGREFPAKVVGADSMTDLAVLSIGARNVPAIPFGDSSTVRVGEFAMAVGNPFGVGQTVTMGIVGATGRGGFGLEDYEDFIQTDAAINPGSSGGALVNMRGELIGINTAIVSGAQGGGSQGVGFAIPTNMARHVMDQIVANGKVVRGWMGVVLQPVTPEIAEAFRLPGDVRGALVSDVLPQGPAARNGIARGDIVIGYNGLDVPDDRDVGLRAAMSVPGTAVTLRVFRNGGSREITFALAEMPVEPPSAPPNPELPEDPHAPPFGLTASALTPEIAVGLNVSPEVSGIVVERVNPAGSAEVAGLRPGDVIEEVDRKPVKSVEDFEGRLEKGRHSALLLLANREGVRRYLVLAPVEP